MNTPECTLTLTPEELTAVAQENPQPAMRGNPCIIREPWYTISQASRITGVAVHILRYWETNGLLRPPRLPHTKPASSTWPWKHRRYGNADIARIFRIKDLMWTEKYTIRGARLRLEERATREEA